MAEVSHRVVGIAWYTREDYPRIRLMMDDGQSFAPIYRRWLQDAEEMELEFRSGPLWWLGWSSNLTPF